MSSFNVPSITDSEEGWGPGPLITNDKLTDIPYAPFSKGDKVGKAADWYGQGRGFQQTRYQTFGASAPFTYRYEEDDESFQLVDTQPKPKSGFTRRRPYGQPWQQRQRQGQQRGAWQQGGKGRQPFQQGRRTGPQQRQDGTRYNRWGQFGDGNRPKQRNRESSVDVRPDWQVVEQVDFSQLTKITTDPPEAEDIISCGSLEYYNKAHDRLSSKSEKPLERIENRAFFKLTTTDDPVIRDLTMQGAGTIFATDAILAALMACPRSVYSWDIVIQRVGSKTFLDRRDNSQFDYLTVNETANEPPVDDKDSINSPFALSQEATFINQNYSQQVLLKGGKKFSFPKPNPFVTEGEEAASVGYRYRRWQLGEHALVARTEVDAVLDDKGQDTLILVKALNEYDPKTGVDWRKKIDTQRGAVLATELKNNSNKLAKWTAQAILAGAEQINLGYVSRVNPKDSFSHVILGTQFYKVKEFATQINLNVKNMWAILKFFFDMFAKLPNGKYIMVKDPNKPLVRLYSVPQDAFEDLNKDQEDGGPIEADGDIPDSEPGLNTSQGDE